MISLAYIVRNEEYYIERSIRSAIDIADELVVVDAISDDRTVEICKEFGAIVVESEWDDDFSHARNIAVAHCSEPWVFMLDADEHLEGESLDLLKRAIDIADEDEIVAYQLMRKNHYPSHDSDSGFFTKPFYPDFQTRLFKNIPEIYFSGRVHEGVVQAIEMSGVGGIGRVPVTIHHHMFRGDKDKYERIKLEYYQQLQEMDDNTSSEVD